MADQNLLSLAPPCFRRHVKLLVPAVFAVISIHSSFKEGWRQAGGRPVVKINAESLSQHDKNILYPLGGIRVGKRTPEIAIRPSDSDGDGFTTCHICSIPHNCHLVLRNICDASATALAKKTWVYIAEDRARWREVGEAYFQQWTVVDDDDD
jgi:hypothetical protein